MSMSRSKYAGHYRQRGAFSIMAAGTLAMALLCLVLVVDSGRLYMEQRSLQRVADMAALEAVSRGGTCRNGTAVDFATQAATNNKLFQHGGELSGVECVDLATNERGIREVQRSNDDSPIIRVITTKTVPASLVIQAGCLLGACEREITLQAEAVAGKEEPIAAFSVGSRLIRFDNDSVLGGVLGLVGADLDDTMVADYNGLAQVKITPRGLLEALGLPITSDLTIGGLNELLAARELSVGDILDAVVTVAGESQLVDANTKILGALLDAGLSSLDLTLLLLTQADGTPGLFAEIIGPATQSANAALNVGVSALGLIETALGLATREHALSVDNLNISLLGLVNVTTQVGVVEPPSIAIGAPTRRDASGHVIQEGVSAYTAQVRTYIRVQTGSVVDALNNLVGLLGINLIKIDLPIALDLVTGRGVLEDKTCTAAAAINNTGKDHAEIAVSGEVGKLCIGLPVDAGQLFSKSFSCERNMQGTEHLDILGLVKLDRRGHPPLTLNLLDIPEEDAYLSLDPAEIPLDWAEMEGRSDFDTVGSSSLNAGDLVENLVNLLLNALIGPSTVSGSSNESKKAIATEIWKGVSPASCNTRDCRKDKMKEIGQLAGKVEGSTGLLSGLVNGLLNLVGGLLEGLLAGNGCTTNGLLGGLLGSGTSDSKCIELIAGELPNSPSNSTNPDNHLGLGILRDLLNALGSSVLTPLLQNLLGLHVGEVDVHLQDLNCGHARLLQ